MAKCPKCGGELSPQENGLWTCAACGKTFSRKAAPVQDTIPADQTEAELRARLAAMEARQAETERQLAAARANNGGGSKTTEFFKNKGNILKIAIPGALLLIALIILLVCFCGLRGIYVNVENPNDYFSFGVGTFSTADGDDVIEGKWSRDGSVLTLTMEDEMFGEIELPVVFRKMSGYDMIEIDGSEYRRVSLIRIEDNMKKVNVRFDGNGGYTNGNSSYQLDLGGKIDEAPSVERTIGDYVFMGWYTSPNGWMDEEAEMFSSGIRLWEDVTYYANWRNDTDYTMTLPDVLEDETDGNEITYREGDDLLSVFMTALGWNELPEGVTGVSFVTSSGDAVDSDSAPATSVTAKLVGNYMAIDGALMYVDPSLTEFVIPDSVTSIAKLAFNDCSNLVSVTIGVNVNSLDAKAFDGCNSLTTLNVDEGNAVYHSAGNCIIDTANKILVLGCKNSVIPSDGSVTTIGSSAFAGCAELSSITIPECITEIGNRAFESCTGLKEIRWNAVAVEDFSENSAIFNNAGRRDDGMVVIFGDSVEKIPACIFYVEISKIDMYSPKITSVILENGVTSIGNSAFESCISLTSITIPDSVTSIGESAFRECTSLTSITIPDSVTSIEGSAFRDCTGLTSITIPDSVTSIGGYAFSGCTGLTSVTIGNGVTSIVRNAFYGCTNLTSVTIGNSVTSIGWYAFSGCSALTSVTIPDSVTSIGRWAFYGCSVEIIWSANPQITELGDYAFSGYQGISITIPNGVTSIGTATFHGCSAEIIWGDNPQITELDSYDFSGYQGTSITIPDSVTIIGQRAFDDCSGLTSITIPDSVTSIERYAFIDCAVLTSVTFEGTVAKWKAISKKIWWNQNCPFTEVVCSDGTVQV